jgi:putative DNA primase/helicase
MGAIFAPATEACKPDHRAAEYVYHTADGQPHQRVSRYYKGGKKQFGQAHWDGSRWVNGLGKGFERAPYRLPELISAKLVLIVEGEKDCETAKVSGLETELGAVTITNPQGAGKWPKGWGGKYLTGKTVVIVPDNDQPGSDHAIAVQRDVSPYAKAVVTVNLPDLPSGGDLTDYLGLGGSVKSIVELITAAIEDAESVHEEPAGQEPAHQEFADQESLQKPHFAVDAKGTWWVSVEDDEEGNKIQTRTRIGNPLAPIAYVNSLDRNEAGILLEFKTQSGETRRWTMPRRALGGDRTTIMGELLAQEYGIVFDQTKRLARYLVEMGAGLTTRYTVTDKTGWVDGSFVLPDRTIGDQTLKFGNPEETTAGKLKAVGTVESWQQSVGAKCAGNSRLIFGVGAALAGPLTPVFEVESGGFHLVGLNSRGKTTTLSVAGSVMGLRKSDLPGWNATANGLEGVAAEFNNLLLPLDEIGQADPRAVGNCAYLLGNGVGKTRMSKNLSTRKPKTWQLLTLSSGEVGLGEYMQQAGIHQKGGQESRMPSIPAIPGNGEFGVFEVIHGYSKAADFVAQLEADCRDNRGAVLTAYLERLAADRLNPGWVKKWRQRASDIASQLAQTLCDATIERVAKRFALVQIALEIAHGYGLLPFSIEQASWAIKTLFTDWVDSRGGAGSIEVKQCLERIESEFTKHQYSDRIYDVDRSPSEPIRNLLAYRKTDDFGTGTEFWVPAAVFKELTAGADRDLVIAELQRRGWLLGPDAEGKNALRRRVGSSRIRAYVFKKFWDDCTPTPSELPSTPSTPILPQKQNLLSADSLPPEVLPQEFCAGDPIEVFFSDDQVWRSGFRHAGPHSSPEKCWIKDGQGISHTIRLEWVRHRAN